LKYTDSDSKSLFNAVYKQYGKEIFGYIKSYFPFDIHLSEDIHQEVFCTAFTRFHTIKDVKKVRSWLYKIASNKCRDRIRSKYVQKKYMLTLQTEVSTKTSRTMEDKYTGKQMFQMLNEEILQLPESLRQIFVLKEYHNMKYHEISEITNVSLSKVKKIMKKAVHHLSERLQERNITREVIKELA
jgi:RNA polymerase sigma-70 factor (ECF subfamily)